MIIGITGTLGSGKGTVAEYLARKHNFVYLSVRNFFAGEVLRRGQMVNRENIIKVAEELRAAHGPHFVIEQVFSQAAGKKNAVVESIRSQAEAEYIRSHGGCVWAVDADPKVRYSRTVKRDQGSKFSLEEFAAIDAQDKELQKLVAGADATLHSDGTKEELFQSVEKALITCGYAG